jgi:O-antigen/teichoic acid export membrane protein
MVRPKNSRSFFSGALWNAALVTVAWPLGVVTAVFVGRRLGPEGKGEYTLALLSGALLYTLLNLGIPNSISYYLSSRRVPQDVLVRTVVQLGLALSAAAMAVAFLLDRTGWCAYVFGVPHLPAAVWVVVLVLPFYFVGALLQFVVLAQGRQLLFALIPAAGQLVVSALSLGLIAAGRLVPWTAVAAVAFSQVLTAALLLCIEHPTRWWRATGLGAQTIREMTRYSALSYTSVTLQFLVQRLDVLLLSSLQDMGQVGLYSVAYGTAELLLLLPQRFGALYLPRVAGAATSGERDRELPRASSLVSVGTLVCGSVLALVVPWGLPLLYGRSFAPAVPLFLLLLPGVAALATCSVLGAFIAGVGEVRTTLRISAAGLALNVVLNLLLIPHYGATAAAAVSSVTYGFQAILLARAAARLTGARPLDMITSASPGLIFSLLRRVLRLPAASPSLG